MGEGWQAAEPCVRRPLSGLLVLLPREEGRKDAEGCWLPREAELGVENAWRHWALSVLDEPFLCVFSDLWGVSVMQWRVL